MWVLTVASLTNSSVAISALESPRAISCRTSRSRSVSSSKTPETVSPAGYAHFHTTRVGSKGISPGDGDNAVYAIIGGTGAYQGARGSMSTYPVPHVRLQITITTSGS